MLMRYFGCVILIVLSAQILKGQKTRRDTLELQIKTVKGNERSDVVNKLFRIIYKEDTTRARKLLSEAEELGASYPKGRVNFLINKARSVLFLEKNTEKTIAIYKEALKLAEAISYTQAIETLYSAISRTYRDSGKMKEAQEAADKGVEYAAITRNLSLKAGMYNCYGTIQYYRGDLEKAIGYYKEAVEMYEKVGDKNEVAGITMNVGIMNYRSGKAKESLVFYEKAMKVLVEIKDSVNIANALINIGLSEKHLGNSEKALERYLLAEKIMRAQKDMLGVANCLENESMAYNDVGKYDKSLKSLNESMKVRENENDQRGMVSTLVRVGEVYERLKDTAKTLEYYIKSKNIAEKIGDRIRYSHIVSTIGVLYSASRKFEEAKKYLFEALEIQKNMNDRVGEGGSFLSIGNYYKRIKDNTNALKYYKESLKIKEQTQDKLSVAGLLNNIGVIYYEDKNYKEAAVCYEKALQMRKEAKNTVGISDSYWSLANLYSALKDYKKAYEYEVLYHTTWDSLNNANISEQMAEMNARYESTEKDKEILQRKASEKEANSRAEKEGLERKNAENKFLFAIIGITLLVVLAGFVINGNIQRKKANKLLAEQNNEIIKQKRELELQKDIVDEKQKEILDSIHYAKRIQKALMANEKYIHKNLERLREKS